MDRKEKLYLRLCDEIDEILIDVGIRKICIECSTIKTYEYKFDNCKDIMDDNALKKKGCCKGCEYLSKKGCSINSMWCKLWLCSSKLEKKIKKSKYNRRWEDIKKIAIKNGWMECRWDYYSKI